jgi:hypothetical protein
VASSGNNGTDDVQWLNYPSAYDGVVSVGAVNCQNEVRGVRNRTHRVRRTAAMLPQGARAGTPQADAAWRSSC